MVQTSLIVGLGLLVYALSEFGPIQRFAWMMFSILMVALVSDLTVTPALLYSRWGRLFLPGPFCRQQPAEVLAVEPNQGPSDSDRRDIRVRPSATRRMRILRRVHARPRFAREAIQGSQGMFKRKKAHRRASATRGRRLAVEVLERREVLSGAWHNAWLPADVTADRVVAPLDALTLINDINAHGKPPPACA